LKRRTDSRVFGQEKNDQLHFFRRCRTFENLSHFQLRATNDTKFSFKSVFRKSGCSLRSEHFYITFNNLSKLGNNRNISFIQSTAKEGVSFLDLRSIFEQSRNRRDSVASLLHTCCERAGRQSKLRCVSCLLYCILHNGRFFRGHTVRYES
jgi:hypothetical protein